MLGVGALEPEGDEAPQHGLDHVVIRGAVELKSNGTIEENYNISASVLSETFQMNQLNDTGQMQLNV